MQLVYSAIQAGLTNRIDTNRDFYTDTMAQEVIAMKLYSRFPISQKLIAVNIFPRIATILGGVFTLP